MGILGAGEIYCRYFTRINYLGNSSELFLANRFGSSYGNLSTGEASSYGVKCYTDKNGFRIDPSLKDSTTSSAILILGDSVGFACGVEENESAIGLLRRILPAIRIYNSSCVGYCLKDYKNVVDVFIPTHPEVKSVVVLMCLNDIYYGSAAEIKIALGDEPQKAKEQDLAVIAKRFAFLQNINDWLRSRSKLYIFLKNRLTDTSMRFFLFDLEMYKNSRAFFESKMMELEKIKDLLQRSGIRFKVIILPYEMQLRMKNDAFMLPQQMISKFLSSNGIDFIDASEDFLRVEGAKNELFLYGDPMHFSPLGHRVLFSILQKICISTGPCELDR